MRGDIKARLSRSYYSLLTTKLKWVASRILILFCFLASWENNSQTYPKPIHLISKNNLCGVQLCFHLTLDAFVPGTKAAKNFPQQEKVWKQTANNLRRFRNTCFGFSKPPQCIINRSRMVVSNYRPEFNYIEQFITPRIKLPGDKQTFICFPSLFGIKLDDYTFGMPIFITITHWDLLRKSFPVSMYWNTENKSNKMCRAI